MKAEDLMKRPYHIELVRAETEDGQVGWVASVAELPGCLSQGDTPEEAAAHIQDAMETWFESVIERNSPIPEPAPESRANGKVLARLPVTLHERLLFEADKEDVSLNQLLVGILSAAVGWKHPGTLAPALRGWAAAEQQAVQPREVIDRHVGEARAGKARLNRRDAS